MKYNWEVSKKFAVALAKDKRYASGQRMIAMVMYKPSVKGYWASFHLSEDVHNFLTSDGSILGDSSELKRKDYFKSIEAAMKAVDEYLKLDKIPEFWNLKEEMK